MNKFAQNIKPVSDEAAYIHLLKYKECRRQRDLLN